MYEQLLKLETYEVSKKPISWERLMDIRRLKDRMIRKCQKLSKTIVPTTKKSSRGDTFVFQTFVAPDDFRCKEMEKWFREQQKRAAATASKRTITANGIVEEHTLAVVPVRRPSTSSKQPIQRSRTNPEPSSRSKAKVAVQKPLPPIQQPTRPVVPVVVPAPVRTVVPMILSPPPLPVLILAQREAMCLDDDGVPPGYNSLDPSTFASFPPPGATSPKPIQTASLLADPSNPEAQPRPTLSRRPSCIKRNSAEIKSVTWADNQDLHDQLSKYEAAVREAQESGERFTLACSII